ncbi:MAG TPA: tetratricopeptide repeat protein [Pyrinomonadaceae bacterium]
MRNKVPLTDAAEAVKAFLMGVEAELPSTPDDRVALLYAPTTHAALVHGGEGAGKTALLSELENYSALVGWDVYRCEFRDGFNSPFDIARSLIEQCGPPDAEKADRLRTKYRELLSAFSHESRRPEPGHAAQAPDYGARVHQRISNEATIGLIVQTIDYLLEAISPVKKLALILVDDLHFADHWSASFLAHLVRRIKRFPVAVCATSGLSGKGRNSRAKFLSGKNRLYEITLSPDPGAERAAEINGLDAPSRLVLNYLHAFGRPVCETELRLLSERVQPPSGVGEILRRLEEVGAVANRGGRVGARYAISNSAWRGLIAEGLPPDRWRRIHLDIADLLQSRVEADGGTEPTPSGLPNAVFQHLLRSGDATRALGYQEVYFSCRVNTYLDHVAGCLRRLHKTLKTNTGTSGASKRYLSYVLASDTIRRAGSVKERIRDCVNHLRVEGDSYRRAEIYGNLCVLHANLKTATALPSAAGYADRAFQEAASIIDPDQRKHITAILNNTLALVRFRQRDAGAAVALEEEALRLLREARPLKNTVMVSKEAVLNSLAQIYSRLLKDTASANGIYLGMMKEARAAGRVEGEVEHAINVGKSLYHARRCQEALPYFLDALRAAGDSYRLLTARMYAHKAAALCYQALGRDEQAVESFRDCLDLALGAVDLSEIAGLLGGLGLSFYRLREYDRAACSYSKALRVSALARLRPLVSKYCANLGVLYADLNEYQKAAKFFFNAARTSSRLGDRENSLRYYAAAMSCNTASGAPCERSILRQVKQAARPGDGVSDSAVYNGFAKAYLEQADILLKRKRHNDATEMLRHFGDLAKGVSLEASLNHQFETLARRAALA